MFWLLSLPLAFISYFYPSLIPAPFYKFLSHIHIFCFCIGNLIYEKIITLDDKYYSVWLTLQSLPLCLE